MLITRKTHGNTTNWWLRYYLSPPPPKPPLYCKAGCCRMVCRYASAVVCWGGQGREWGGVKVGAWMWEGARAGGGGDKLSREGRGGLRVAAVFQNILLITQILHGYTLHYVITPPRHTHNDTTQAQICKFLCIFACTYMHAYICVCVCAYVYAHMCIYIYIYI